MDKVLFLDVDGVLNILSTTYYSAGHHVLGHDPIEPHLMRRLEFILDRVPGCMIVVSSSWFFKQLVSKLTKARFKYVDRIIDRTPRGEDERGDQIKEWITTNNFTGRYVVLEDEIIDVCIRCTAIPRELVIEVDMNEGLSNKNTVDAVIILQNIESYDGVEFAYTQENHDMAIKLGYSPNVKLTNDDNELEFSRWVKFKLINKSLTMLME